MLTICTRVAGLHIEITADGIHLHHKFNDMVKVIWLDSLKFLFIIVRFETTIQGRTIVNREIEWCVNVTTKLLHTRRHFFPPWIDEELNINLFSSTCFEMQEFFPWSEFNYAPSASNTAPVIMDVFNGIVDLYNDPCDENNVGDMNEMFLRECGNTFIKICNIVCSTNALIHVAGNTYVEVSHCTFRKNLVLYLSEYAKIFGNTTMVEQNLFVNASVQSICAGFLTLGSGSEFEAKQNAKISVYIQCPERGKYKFIRSDPMAQINVCYTENSLLMKWRRSIQSRIEVWRFLNRKLHRTSSRTPIGRSLAMGAAAATNGSTTNAQYQSHHQNSANSNSNSGSSSSDEENENFEMNISEEEEDEEEEKATELVVEEAKSTRIQLNATRDMKGFSCVICCEALVEIIMKPCAHACLCRKCAKKYFKIKNRKFTCSANPNCPLCRREITQVEFVYFS